MTLIYKPQHRTLLLIIIIIIIKTGQVCFDSRLTEK